ncbi:MAG: LptE family protein [bacterium]|nr:LptE family protein [bacterium]
MKKIFIVTLLIAIVGCGYTFQGSGSVLPPEIKNIFIPTVENQTSENRITNLLTEALRERFERYGVITVVDKPDLADAILKVEVLSVEREARSVTSGTDTVLQYETVAQVFGDLKRKDGLVLWRNPLMSVAKGFGTTGQTVVTSSADFAQGGLDAQTLAALNDVEISRGQEQEALIDLSEEVAKSIYEDAVAPDF